MFSVSLPHYDLHYNIILSYRSSPRPKLMTAPLATSRILGFTTIPILYIVIRHRLCLGRWMFCRPNARKPPHTEPFQCTVLFFFYTTISKSLYNKTKKIHIIRLYLTTVYTSISISLSLSLVSSRVPTAVVFYCIKNT